MSSELCLATIRPRIEELGSSEWMSLTESAASAHQSLHYLYNSQKLAQEDTALHPVQSIREIPMTSVSLTQTSIGCSMVKHSKQESQLWTRLSPCSTDSYQEGWGLQQNCVWYVCLDFVLKHAGPSGLHSNPDTSDPAVVRCGKLGWEVEGKVGVL